jgi:hypothetical protein
MLAHGKSEVEALATRCSVTEGDDANGWRVDVWNMNDLDVDGAVAIYKAVLEGGASDSIIELLAEGGIDLNALLVDTGKDDITRSDITELTAAASLVAVPGCNVDLMYMPNVPKMSRRKSDSGIDIFVAIVNSDQVTAEELEDGEHLTIASVKHTVKIDSASDIRWKLANSLSENELSAPYLASQLRVLNARMQQEGVSQGAASRLYLFLRDFPQRDSVDLFAIAIADPDLRDDLEHQVTLLPDAGQSNRTFRMILMPGLRTVHERCS